MHFIKVSLVIALLACVCSRPMRTDGQQPVHRAPTKDRWRFPTSPEVLQFLSVFAVAQGERLHGFSASRRSLDSEQWLAGPDSRFRVRGRELSLGPIFIYGDSAITEIVAKDAGYLVQ